MTEQQKGCLCFSWLWQLVSGLCGGKEGDYNVCMHMERLLTKHMACSFQRSRSAAKPRRSRRGYIPGDPEGDCEGCCNPGSSASCWAPEHLEGELILKGNRIQGEDLFSKHLFMCTIRKTCIWCILMGCLCSNKTERLELLLWFGGCSFCR